jgi:integrase
MAAKVFTVPFIDNSKPSRDSGGNAVRTEYPDARQPGLYLIVQPNGKKSWAVRYRFAGIPRKHTIGSYPGVKLESARQIASKALTAVAEGRDPGIEKQKAKDEQKRAILEEKRGQRDLFENVCREFIERYAKPKALSKGRPDAWNETARILGLRVDPENPSKLIEVGGDVIPLWKGRKVQEITKRDVNDLLDGIVDRGAPIMANRALAAVRKLFNWCVSRDIIVASPCASVEPPAAERSRDRILTDAELRLAWDAASAESWPFGPLVRMLILTGQRLNEVSGMRWEEIDFPNKLWTLPAERVKNNTAHEIPLSNAAVEILQSLPCIRTTEGVIFTTTRDAAVTGFSRAKARLDAVITSSSPNEQPLEHWTFHDLRRTMASGMARIGIQLPVIEKILNHSSGSFRGIVGVYQRHTFAGEKRRALDAWANYVLDLENPERRANVINLPR